MITIEQLSACFPSTSPKTVRPYYESFLQEMESYGINTPVRMAAFLAQVGHESGSLKYREEIASGDAYTNRKDLGNTHPKAIACARAKGLHTGPFYKGHGFIQITGYTNHLAYSMAEYNDDRCVITPQLLTQAPDVVGSACWFWANRNLNILSDAGTIENFKKITRRINGGYNGYEDRVKRWGICEKVLGA